jgi:NifU-like protein involved in Fe-S cluster formation
MTQGRGTDTNHTDGDRVTIELDLDRGTVTVLKAEATGCDSIGLVVRTLETLTHRQSEDRVWLVDVDAIRRSMGAMSDENTHCASTAIAALRAALVDAHVRARAGGEART